MAFTAESLPIKGKPKAAPKRPCRKSFPSLGYTFGWYRMSDTV